MANLQRRLEAAEARAARAEAACTALVDHETSVGVTVPAGEGSVPVYFVFAGPASLAVDLLDKALEDAEHRDESELLTNLLVTGAEWWDSGHMVARRLPHVDSALLADPMARTVTLYRPLASGEAPLGCWSFENWRAEARPAWGPEAGTKDERERAYARGEAFVDWMQPGHTAAYREMQAAEDYMFSARQAVKAATRPNLRVVPTT